VEQAGSDSLADGHRFWFGFATTSGPTVRRGLLAAGYLISSVSDLGRYLSMYINDGKTPDGVQIISSESLRTMLSPGPETTLGPWADGARARYAMGWFVGGPWDEPALLHPGNAPDSSAMIVLLPQRGWAFAGVTNATSELPGAPPVIDRLSRNSVDVVVGEIPAAANSLRTFYVIFDLLALMLLLLAGWDLVRAVRRLGPGTQARRPWLTWVGVNVRVILVVVLLRLPGATGYGWPAAWLWLPDLTLVIGILAALLAATAFLTVVADWRARRRGGGIGEGSAPHSEQSDTQAPRSSSPDLGRTVNQWKRALPTLGLAPASRRFAAR
jgi:hypothetical protein